MQLRNRFIEESREVLRTSAEIEEHEHASPTDSTTVIPPGSDIVQSSSSSNSQDSTKTTQQQTSQQVATSPRTTARATDYNEGNDINTNTNTNQATEQNRLLSSPQHQPRTPPPHTNLTITTTTTTSQQQQSIYQTPPFTNPFPSTNLNSGEEEPWNTQAPHRTTQTRLQYSRRLSSEHALLGELREPEWIDKLGTEIEGMNTNTQKRKSTMKNRNDEDDEEYDEEEEERLGRLKRSRVLRPLKPKPSSGYRDPDLDGDGNGYGGFSGFVER